MAEPNELVADLRWCYTCRTGVDHSEPFPPLDAISSIDELTLEHFLRGLTPDEQARRLVYTMVSMAVLTNVFLFRKIRVPLQQ